MPLEDTDAAFVRRVQAAITAQLADADFDVAALAAELFMSKRTLQRRMAELTGFPAGAYLRHVRLLHAKELLERNAYHTLSEVARAVGFQNVSNFSKQYRDVRREAKYQHARAPLNGRFFEPYSDPAVIVSSTGLRRRRLRRGHAGGL